ncbi:hypothetical protein MJH12_08900 [bacterium]|nr:hypothetical protein [bacterium]
MKSYHCLLLLLFTKYGYTFGLDESIHSIRTNFVSSTNKISAIQVPSVLSFSTDFRNQFSGSFGEEVTFQLHLNHRFSEKKETLPFSVSPSRFEQFSHHLYQDQHFTSKIDRLQFNFSHKDLDFVFGRQALSFGTSHFISVMDVINPFPPGTIDSSFKPGIDALRIQKALGDTGELEFIFAPNEYQKDNAYFIRTRQLVNQIDYEFLMGRFRSHNMVALGFEGEIKEQSIWGEIALIRYDDNLLDSISKQSNQLSYNIGLDFHPKDGENISISWFHQNSGAKDANDYLRVLTNPSFREQFAYLKGRDYINLSYTNKLKPLVDASVAFIYNVDDQSVFVQPKLSINTSDDSNLVLFYTFGLGSRVVFNKAISDFGDLPNTFGVFTQYYF